MDIAGKLSNFDAWLYLIILSVVVFLLVYIAKTGYKLYQEKYPSTRQILIRKIVMSSVFLFLFVFFFFMVFGSGEPSKSTPVEDTGEYKYMQEVEAEKSAEELEKEAEESKDMELRIQSDDSLRDIYLEESEKKSNEVIEKYLE